MGVADIIKNLGDLILFFLLTASIYPISRFVLPKLKSRNSAAWFHIIWGIPFLLDVCGKSTPIALLYIVVGYYTISIDPIVNGVLNFFLNLLLQVYAYYYSKGWTLDLTFLTMVICQKLISLGFNIDDGKKDQSSIPKRFAVVSVKSKPIFIDYLAYTLTPLGSYQTPFIEYKIFDFILNRHERPYDPSPEDRANANQRFYGSFLWALTAIGSLSLVSYDWYFSEYYLSLNFLLRTVVVCINTTGNCIRYYSVWWNVESGFHELGACSAGIVEPHELSNLSYLEVVSSGTISEFLRRWNHSTHLFWKNYLYNRLSKNLSPAIGRILVLTISEIWHGVRPVYYLMLPEMFIMSQGDFYLNKVLPFRNIQSKFWRVFRMLYVCMEIFYTTSTWFYPTYEQFLYVRKSIYFFPIIVSAILWVSSIIHLNLHHEKKKPKPE